MQLASLAELADRDARVQLNYDGALAAIGEVGPRRAAAIAVRAARDGGRINLPEIDDDLITAADRLVAHFSKVPTPPPMPSLDDGDAIPLAAAPRITAPVMEASPLPAGPRTADGGRRRQPEQAPRGAEAPFLEERAVSVRTFQRRFNQIRRRLEAEAITADNVRGSDTEAAITRVFAAYGEARPDDPGHALQRANEIAQGWYTGDASLKDVQQLAVAVLGDAALPSFGPDGIWGAETEAMITALNVPGIDPAGGLTAEERNVIYYEFGLGNRRWRDQKAGGRR
jgi:hypothetical protein